MQGTSKILAGPAYIAAAAANIYNPPASTYGEVHQIHVANVTNAAATFSLYIGATGGSAGGTEIAKTYTVAAFSCVDLFFQDKKLGSTQFLTGICEAGASKLTVLVTGKEAPV